MSSQRASEGATQALTDGVPRPVHAGGTCARGATAQGSTPGQDGEAPPTVAAGGVLDVHVQGAAVGAKVSHRWMQEAALAEWQRLTALSS